MSDIAPILIDLFVIFLAAKVAGEVFERLGQPPVIGELLAGVVVGPHMLGLLGAPDHGLITAFHEDQAAAGEALRLVYHVIAELGVIILLFYVGLETRVSDLLRVGPRAMLVGMLGIVFPFGFGLAFMVAQQTPGVTAVFTATALVATSVGITARVLRDLGVLGSTEARVILGAAVIDDILGMVLLAVVVALGAGGAMSPLGMALLLTQAIGFVVFVVLVGAHVVGRYSIHLERLRIENAPFALAIMITLGLAALSGMIGLAAIIGAFLAGMVLAEAKERYQLERQVLPLYQFLVPFFFVITGTEMNLAVFGDPAIVALAAAITLLAIAGKVIGGALGAWGLGGGNGIRSMAIVGTGMIPRGEVGLIIAGIGRAQGVIPDYVFSAIVIMCIATTLVAPPVLKLLYGKQRAAAAPGAEHAKQEEQEEQEAELSPVG